MNIQRYFIRIAAVVFIVLLLPPVKRVLEASMTTQMLVQIPLLIATGYLLRRAPPEKLAAEIATWNHSGVSGLVLASVASMVWMLPRSLDAAVSQPWLAAAKYISVPLLIGLPLGLSWPRMGFVVKGVFLFELIATFFRLGWLYMISPVRLCNYYLLDDQQRLGGDMLAIGSGLLLWIAWKVMWGRLGDAQCSARQPL